MRCLYCGKERSLFKRFTGEFCSEAHRQSYKEESDKLALSRLTETRIPRAELPAPARVPLAEKLELHPEPLPKRIRTRPALLDPIAWDFRVSYSDTLAPKLMAGFGLTVVDEPADQKRELPVRETSAPVPLPLPKAQKTQIIMASALPREKAITVLEPEQLAEAPVIEERILVRRPMEALASDPLVPRFQDPGSRPSRFSARVVAGSASGVLAACLGIGYLEMRPASGHTTKISEIAQARNPNWGTDSYGSKVIRFYRPSLQMTDYRAEFDAPLGSTALSFVFRAGGPKNFYAVEIRRNKNGSGSMLEVATSTLR